MFTVGWETAPLYEREVCMKAVVKVDIVDGKCVVIYSDGSEQELYDYPSDEGGGGDVSLMDEKLISQNGEYSASSDGYDGYKKVNVNVVAPLPTLGVKQIVDNGTYTADDDGWYGYARVIVNVPSGGTGVSVEDWLNRSQPTGDIVFNAGTTLAPALSYNTHITSFVSNTVNKFQTDNTFNSCTALKLLRFMATMNNPINQGAFRSCSNLLTVSMPNLTNTVSQYSMYNCPKLHTVDVGSATAIQANTFGGSSALNKLIIRRSSVCTLQNISAFGSTPYANNGSGGTLYVPNALIASYQAASNWSTILGYANNSIVAIEGSEFENKTADGTSIT